ncbi:MAG: phosphoribosylformylglycinamidine synthase [Bacteroidales bacterium]|nr:phosphoribosylformylglycinamidine synthase [Bacteroidales bacterium]
MVLFFKTLNNTYFVVEIEKLPDHSTMEKMLWLFGNAENLKKTVLEGVFVGPRKEMITPWSTNAVEIMLNMGIRGVSRVEMLQQVADTTAEFDPMLQNLYENPNQDIFKIDKKPDPIVYIDDMEAYNKKEGLALSNEEIKYLEGVSEKIGRKLTDSEVYGFAQVNSEHCRHKIFNGTFIINGKEKPNTLFSLIKNTSKVNPNFIVSAYKDNVAFIVGPKAQLFSPLHQDISNFFEIRDTETVISLKAETHNFPTTVEPFNGAATGTGGEIRDRMAGGKGSFPIAGTAVYMTAYSRNAEEQRVWEQFTEPRPWLYQTPEQILIKASNGASDFGNKFGQPLICGSLLTFEHFENQKKYGYDKVIMQAGGVGFAKYEDSLKETPEAGDVIVVFGGDNYRIGMGGGAVSSVATGEYSNSIELNAVQRANPEMQKRVANVIRSLSEQPKNPIITVHDHGAGGHLNCLSELIEETGGVIDVDQLPVGDPTLSLREIIGNESQERMGLVVELKDIPLLRKIAERERSPMYEVGVITDDHQFVFEQKNGVKPIDLQVEDFFGKPPRTVLEDKTIEAKFAEPKYDEAKILEYTQQLLQIESVACKDWLTNKVDRSVTGKIAKQQCCGELQLPLNDVAVVAMDYQGEKGIATSLGHAPMVALSNPKAGSRLSIAEALTNIVWAPLTYGLKGVSLSANWMWPAKNAGENDRLYRAVEALSEFAIALGINIPTGKDSLSMTQKYPNGEVVFSPGTVIISAAGEVSDITRVVEPVLKNVENSKILYINLSQDDLKIGGSAFAQLTGAVGTDVPDVKDAAYFVKVFNALQELNQRKEILAGHDVAAGGLITTLLEMTFAQNTLSMMMDLSGLSAKDDAHLFFNENPAVVVQVKNPDEVEKFLKEQQISYHVIGIPMIGNAVTIKTQNKFYQFDIPTFRKLWFKTSYLFDCKQSGETCAKERYENFDKIERKIQFPEHFTGRFADWGIVRGRRKATGIKAAIIREKGCQCDREMAWSLYLAGFDVKDVHVTDLTSGRETLEDVNMIAFVGGFSNSDVLGSAKGWAGALKYNELAQKTIENYYKRKDTLSLGVCNGCQLMVELGLVYPEHEKMPKMLHNNSHKFESNFVTVDILPNESIMLKTLVGSRLGIWIAHGEGKYLLPYEESQYMIPVKYAYNVYPANPNGSDYNAAAICSHDGRHLAMMPHLERAIYPWQWAVYPDQQTHEATPWIEAFVNARKWVEERVK